MLIARTARAGSLASWLSIAALVAGGCTVRGADPDAGGVEPADAGDAARGDTGDPFVDSGPPVDGGGRDAGPSSGLQCEACATDDDCSVGAYCVALTGGGRVCLRSCEPDLPSCPNRFDCIESLITDLPTPVCTPVGERCCVDADGDDHGVGVGCRGLDCDDDDADVSAGASERCNGVDDDCDGAIDEGGPGAGLVCSTGMTGACSSGVTVCEDGAVVCRADAASMVETCNGMDDDCDSNVDEDDMGRALTRPCYDGPAGTDGVGGCTAGVQTCAGGEYRTCVGQVVPSTEDCDGVDDDCDGVVDDGNPGGGFACTTSAPGVCAAGTTRCMGSGVACVGTIAPGTQPEVCDAVDNDCDGMLNEGFAGLGTACFAGAGICRRAGVTVCNPASPSSPPICDATAGAPSPAETCDYADDDCDGATDEGFRNGAGVYHTVAHCGACGFDCNLGWPGGPATYHVVPSCTVGGASASCGFTCQAGYVDADGVRENGCELLPEAGTIYVSTPANGGADVSGCGAWDAPCATIGGGIARATAAGRTRVRVSTGLYNENVTLASGVSVLGGHSHVNWVRNPAVFATTIRGRDLGAGADRVVVTAISITAPTELSGFTIQGVNAQPGGNSISVYVRDSDADLLIRDNDIAPGAGGNGATGAAGSPGAPGTTGATGLGPERLACGSSARAGGVGGARTCAGTTVSGGSGGSGTSPVTSATAPTRSGSGATGSTARGGAGGGGGFHMEGSTSGGPFGGAQCTILMSPIEGAPGVAGSAGSDGPGGAGAASGAGSIVASQWRGAAGAAGAAGASGGGGGGGGSPGGVEASSYCLFPATGGGGGAGGCAGAAGAPGSAGGASFAIFIVHTTAPTAAAMPRVVGNSLRRGSGGRGGDGGTGGGGGEGGAGGAGGPSTSGSTSGDTFAFCLLAGAPGGAGGRGGHAGGGGGSAGGVSYDVWVSRPGSAMPDYSMNAFEIAAGTNTGGAGGVGGNSSNTAIGLGGAGAAGAFGNVRVGS